MSIGRRTVASTESATERDYSIITVQPTKKRQQLNRHTENIGLITKIARFHRPDFLSSGNNRTQTDTLRSSSLLPKMKNRCLVSDRGCAVLAMSLALAIHLGGYEFARAAAMALFTSDGLGFGKTSDHSNTNQEHNNNERDNRLSALPLSVGCVSPFSVLLLWFYARTLESGGPAYALRIHTFICASIQIVVGWTLGALDKLLKTGKVTNAIEGAGLIGPNFVFPGLWSVKSMSQPLLFALFVSQNAYVQLLYAQHWAFISSVLTPEEGTKIFAPIAGLGSIGSTIAAGLVSVLVERVGLVGLLYLAGASFIVSAFLANLAFRIARRHGFEPKGSRSNDAGGVQRETNRTTKGNFLPSNDCKDAALYSSSGICCATYCQKGGLFQQAISLFQRVPILGALFVEVIISQSLSSLVNYIYLYKLKESITDDTLRAGWSGNFYAWINGVSGVFQFFIIPLLLKYCEAHRIWLLMPTMMLCCTVYQFLTHHSSSLFGASASFFVVKTMEYSLRGAANEMLYVSLDYESRYLGKKVISLVAGKFGKSCMAVALSFAMIMYGDRIDLMWHLLAIAVAFTLLWFISSLRLHFLIECSSIR